MTPRRLLLCILSCGIGCAAAPEPQVQTDALVEVPTPTVEVQVSADSPIQFVGTVQMETAWGRGFLRRFEEDVQSGFLNAGQLEELLEQRRVLESRRGEITPADRDRFIGVAGSRLYFGDTYWKVFNEAASAAPGAVIYIETPPEGFPYCTMRSVLSLEQFVGLEHSFGFQYDIDEATAQSLLKQRAACDERRAQLLAASPHALVAVLNGEAYVHDTESELFDALRRDHPSMLVYYEDAETERWGLVDTASECGDAAMIPGFASAVHHELRGVDRDGKAVTRAFIGGASTATQPSHISRRTLRGLRLDFRGVIALRAEGAEPESVFPLYEGVELKLCRDDGSTAQCEPLFVLSTFDIVGMDVLWRTRTWILPPNPGSPALKPWPEDPPPPPPEQESEEE